MKNIKRKTTVGLLILACITLIIGLLQYNKPHIDVENTNVDYIVSAASFIKEFSTDEMTADNKYVNKIIEIKGNVSSVSSSNGIRTVTLTVQGYATGITCNFQSTENTKIVKLKTNQSVVIRGICTGMLLDIMMKECIIVN